MLLKVRKTTMFEKILLIVGLAVTLVGFYLIRMAYATEKGLTWLMLLTIFSWLTVLILFIVSSLNADVKEELMRILGEQVEETRLLKEISHEQLAEMKKITQAYSVQKKKR
jgi:hypothetical protein